MIKCLPIILCILVFAVEEVHTTPFIHKIVISPLANSAEKPEYLVHFAIDKIVVSEVVAVTRPVVQCVEGEESIFTKSVNGNGYTVKALVYKVEGMTKAKTSLVLHEGDVVVYSACDDHDLRADD